MFVWVSLQLCQSHRQHLHVAPYSTELSVTAAIDFATCISGSTFVSDGVRPPGLTSTRQHPIAQRLRLLCTAVPRVVDEFMTSALRVRRAGAQVGFCCVHACMLAYALRLIDSYLSLPMRR